MSATTVRPRRPGRRATGSPTTSVDRVVAAAGAGSGKTTQLVQRVLTTLSGAPDAAPTPASQIAVITFTDKAAPRTGAPAARRARTVPIEDAYIGTIHGFCASILRSFPVEAGLPPKFSTADEITSSTDAEARARAIVAEVYRASATTPELREALTVVAEVVGLRSLPSIVSVIDRRWDQFQDLVLDPPSRADLDALHRAAVDCGDGFVSAWPSSAATFGKFVEALHAARPALPGLGHAARFDLPTLRSVGGAAAKADRDAIKDACAEVRALAHVDRAAARGAGLPGAGASPRHRPHRSRPTRLRRPARADPAPARRAPERAGRAAPSPPRGSSSTSSRTPIASSTRSSACSPTPTRGRRRPPVRGCSPSATRSSRSTASARRRSSCSPRSAASAAADGYLAELTANFRTRADVADWINRVMTGRFADPATAVVYEQLAPQRPAALPDEHEPGPPVVLLGVEPDRRRGPGGPHPPSGGRRTTSRGRRPRRCDPTRRRRGLEGARSDRGRRVRQPAGEAKRHRRAGCPTHGARRARGCAAPGRPALPRRGRHPRLRPARGVRAAARAARGVEPRRRAAARHRLAHLDPRLLRHRSVRLPAPPGRQHGHVAHARRVRATGRAVARRRGRRRRDRPRPTGAGQDRRLVARRPPTRVRPRCSPRSTTGRWARPRRRSRERTWSARPGGGCAT